MLKWYFDTWCKIMFRPIYFFTLMPEGEWTEEPVSFAAISSWIVAAVLSCVIFITQYIPIGVTLVGGISGMKFLIIFPVLLLLSFMFFLITFVISGGMLMVAFFCLFYALGYILHYALKFAGGKGRLADTVKSSFYSSGVVVFGVIPLILAMIVKRDILTFGFFMVGYNIIYFMAALYYYGLISIAVKKCEHLSKGKALVFGVLPLAVFVLLGIFVNKYLLPAIEPFLS
ncbi:MAG: hypothetical protein ABIJ26_03940 [Candidatus Margulisiibacteriota bacterium]